MLLTANRRPIVDAAPASPNSLVEKFHPTKHTTIGSVKDADLRIYAYCFDCGYDQDADLNRVAGEFGRDQSVLPVHPVPKLIVRNTKARMSELCW